LYLLFRGGSHPQMFRGNAALASVTESIVANRLDDQPSAHGPHLWITGEGTAQDFDAAMLTMDLKWSAHPSKESRISTERNHILDSAIADNESDQWTRQEVLDKLTTIGNGNDDRDPVVTYQDGQWALVSSFNREKFTVAGRTRDAVAIVWAAIFDGIRNFIDAHRETLRPRLTAEGPVELTAGEKAELLMLVQERARDALRAYYEATATPPESRDTVQVSGTIGQLSSWTVVQLARYGVALARGP